MKALTSAAALLIALTLSSTAFAQTADLSVASDTVRDGDDVDVTLTVSNAGPDAVFTVDVAVQFDDATVTAIDYDDGCSLSSIGLVCSFNAQNEALIDVGQSLTLNLTLQTAEDVEVVVSVTSVSDPDPGNDSTTFQTGAPGAMRPDAGDAASDAGDEPVDTGDGARAADGCCATTDASPAAPTSFFLLGLLVVARRRN